MSHIIEMIVQGKPKFSVIGIVGLFAFVMIAGCSQSSPDSSLSGIFEAVTRESVDDIRFFIEQGVDVNTKDSDGWTPLHCAAQFNPSVKVLEYLIAQGVDVNARDDDGWTPLHCAAQSNSSVKVQYLIAQGADVNAKDNDGWTPLHYVAMFDSTSEVLEYLIKKGADVNARDNDGETPLDLADTGEMKAILREAGGKSGKE